MKKIETRILNPEAVGEAEKMMVCAGRLTQRGEHIKSMDDFMELYNRAYTKKTLRLMTGLPHPTLQKYGVVNAVVVGASRRFLAQITRHQNEVKYMSASLQYSDYSGEADFVVPYEILGDAAKEAAYIESCARAMEAYVSAVADGISNDSAGYMAPQGLRNILIISATPFQWKHMIGQRSCRRNTVETRYVMLRIWERLHALNPVLFGGETTGPFCMRDSCKEGRMSCARVMDAQMSPAELIARDYPLLTREDCGSSPQ